MGWRDGSTKLTALPGRRPQEPAAGPWMPDPVFPDEAHPPSSYLPPEKRLMWAVLEDAITLLRKPERPLPPHPGVSPTSARYERYEFASAARNRSRAREEAAAWVASGDLTWPYSFENVCGALGFDPDWLRRRIASLTPGSSRRGRPSLRSSGTDTLTPGVARTRAEAAQRANGTPWSGLGRGAG